MKLPSSLDFERVFLASIIKNPVVIPDYLDHLSDELFHADIHRIICGAVRNQYKEKKTVDPIILSDYLSNIGVRTCEEHDIPDYIQSITSRSAVGGDKIRLYFVDLMKYKIARSAIRQCIEAQNQIQKNINSSVGEIIAIAEKCLTKAVTAAIEDEYTPVDIYDGLDEFVENLSEQINTGGILTPFKTWNRWWGGLTEGDLTVIAAPPKTGKSTILNYIADSAFCKYNSDKEIKVLILDTELETHRVRTRKVSALSGVNESYIKNGSWTKNEELTDKVQGQFSTINRRIGKVKHLYVANVPMPKICSIVKRWRATDTNPDDLCLVVYDYLKITGESVNDSNKEYQVIGEKCDALKHLMSEVRAAGIAAVQTNSDHDVAMSQRIKWFASNIYMFRKKRPEELAEHGEKWGTHVLYPFCLRNQGPDWENEEYVKEQKQGGVTWTTNQLFIESKNFNLKECGTLAEYKKESENCLDIEEPEDYSPRRGKRKPKVVEEDLL